MKILLVDDEAAIVDLLSGVCTREGHDVVGFTSSLQALDYLASHKVDLLFTDLVMPPPDGLQLIRDARQLQSHLMAVAATGYAGRYTPDEVLAAGASDLIFKPFRLDELKARIAMADERRRLVQDLQNRRHALQQMSADMIKGLESELEEARRTPREK